MTAQNDLDRQLTAYLRDGPEELPDASFDALRDRMDQTRQRVVIGPWRSPEMNSILRIGLAAAAVIALVFVGAQLLGSSGGLGGPGPEPTLEPSAAPIPSSGSIEPGTYVASDGVSSFRVTFPAGWDASVGLDFRKHRDEPGEVSFWIFTPDINVWPDACATGSVPPPTGPTADDLLAALDAQHNSDVSEPAEITFGGLPGVRLDVGVPEGLDPAECEPEALRIWSDATDSGNWLAFGGPGTSSVHIVETTSGRLVVSTAADTVASAADLAELQAILDSIQIERAP